MSKPDNLHGRSYGCKGIPAKLGVVGGVSSAGKNITTPIDTMGTGRKVTPNMSDVSGATQPKSRK